MPPYTAIEDGTVFASGGLSLGAYDALTGAVRWRQEDTRTLGAIAVVGSSAIGVTRTSLNQVVTGSALRAWSVADGHRQWSVSVGGPDDRFTDPIVANGVVFVGRWTGEGSSGVFAFRRTSGALLSAFRTSGPIRALAVVGDTLLVPDAGTLRAFRVG